MIQLHDVEHDTPIGTITEEQLELLAEHLEEESLEDSDYYLSGETIDMLEDRGVDADVVTLLRDALDGRDGLDVRWTRD